MGHGHGQFLAERAGASTTTNYGLANLLLGNYQTYTQSDGIYYGDFRYVGLEGYAQDTWRPTSRVTLDYGLRVAYLGATYYGRAVPAELLRARTRTTRRRRSAIVTATGVLRGSIVPGSGNFFNGMVEEGLVRDCRRGRSRQASTSRRASDSRGT